jgi:hypothetical protein
MDELDECPGEVLTYWRAFALTVDGPPAESFGITVFRGGTEALEDFWEHGKGAAAIRWFTDGAMQRCIREVRKHAKMADPGGYCATRHKRVTGEWPTTGGKKGIPS